MNKVDDIFCTHKLNDLGFAKVKMFKKIMSSAVSNVVQDLPETRNKAIFLSKIEEAMFFGTKAIAEEAHCHTEKISY